MKELISFAKLHTKPHTQKHAYMNIAYTQLHIYILELVLHTYIHIYLLNERKFIKPKQKRYAFSKHIH